MTSGEALEAYLSERLRTWTHAVLGKPCHETFDRVLSTWIELRKDMDVLEQEGRGGSILAWSAPLPESVGSCRATLGMEPVEGLAGEDILADAEDRDPELRTRTTPVRLIAFEAATRRRGSELLPRPGSGLVLRGSCSEPAPCSHAGALAIVLAQLVQAQPELLLTWRPARPLDDGALADWKAGLVRTVHQILHDAPSELCSSFWEAPGWFAELAEALARGACDSRLPVLPRELEPSRIRVGGKPIERELEVLYELLRASRDRDD